MKNALILHGTNSDSAQYWFPWIKEELEKLDYAVWAPDLPDATKPNMRKYKTVLFGSKNFEFNKDTILIGHSSGAVAVLFLLQALPTDIKIHSAYLVGAFKDDLGWESLDELFLEPLNFEKIKTKAKKLVFFHSNNDPHCPLEGAKYLAEKTGGELIVIPGQKHFNITTAGEKYRQFPKLLLKIKEITKN